jgi:hypothetical protein
VTFNRFGGLVKMVFGRRAHGRTEMYAELGSCSEQLPAQHVRDP